MVTLTLGEEGNWTVVTCMIKKLAVGEMDVVVAKTSRRRQCASSKCVASMRRTTRAIVNKGERGMGEWDAEIPRRFTISLLKNHEGPAPACPCLP